MTDDLDFDSEPEIPSDDEIAIIVNVHMPCEGRAFDRDFVPARPTFHDQFRPTNAIWLPKIKYTPPDPKADAEAKPWVQVPSSIHEYFNYGFTEAVWEAYKFKQHELRRIFADKDKDRPTVRRHQRGKPPDRF
jgi:hypothetical protein